MSKLILIHIKLVKDLGILIMLNKFKGNIRNKDHSVQMLAKVNLKIVKKEMMEKKVKKGNMMMKIQMTMRMMIS